MEYFGATTYMQASNVNSCSINTSVIKCDIIMDYAAAANRQKVETDEKF